MPKIRNAKIRAWTNFADPDTISICIFGERIPENSSEPVRRVKVNDEFEFVNMDSYQTNTTLRLTQERAQQLVNDFWDNGIRPIAAKGSSGQLEAVERHLKDMRHIAFEKMEIKLPEN